MNHFKVEKIPGNVAVFGYSEEHVFPPRLWKIATSIAEIAMDEADRMDHCFIKSVKLIRNIEELSLRQAKYLMKGAYGFDTAYRVDEQVFYELSDDSCKYTVSEEQWEFVLGLAKLLGMKGCASAAYATAMELTSAVFDEFNTACFALNAAREQVAKAETEADVPF